MKTPPLGKHDLPKGEPRHQVRILPDHQAGKLEEHSNKSVPVGEEQVQGERAP